MPPLQYSPDGLTPEQRHARRKYLTVAAQMHWPALLTLTTPTVRKLTKHRLAKTLKAFAKLRRTKSFAAIKGGIAALEVAYSQGVATGVETHYMVHIHALIECRWVAIDSIAKAWKRAFGGKAACHVRRVNRRVGCLRYITKPPEIAWRILFEQKQVTIWGTCRKQFLAEAKAARELQKARQQPTREEVDVVLAPETNPHEVTPRTLLTILDIIEPERAKRIEQKTLQRLTMGAQRGSLVPAKLPLTPEEEIDAKLALILLRALNPAEHMTKGEVALLMGINIKTLASLEAQARMTRAGYNV